MNELDEYFAIQDEKERKILDKQMTTGLRMINRWETMFREEHSRLFEHTLKTKIPYWKHWIKKYKWVAPSIPRVLREQWEVYKPLKWICSGDTKDLNSLF